MSGNEALSYVYKILMNSLYGRLGINPKSTITEICDEDRYNRLIRDSELIFGEKLSEDSFIVSYHSDSSANSDHWEPPKLSAVQLAAAITASARIHMYPYISREDCYYTDTDSVVLKEALSKEDISSSALGKFKLEARIEEGFFLAPKTYSYKPMDGGKPVLKFKGPAKGMVYPEWFELQYEDPTRTELVQVTSHFRIDWDTLDIVKKDSLIKLGIRLDSKRKSIFSGERWVDTEPLEVEDSSYLNKIGIQVINALKQQINQLQDENKRLAKRHRPNTESTITQDSTDE